MISTFKHKDGLGEIQLIKNEVDYKQIYYQRNAKLAYYTIAWNVGKKQKVTIDEMVYDFEENALLPLMLNQSFSFEFPENIIAWKFNRDFYCVLNHDAEVGCIGFIFYGPSPTMFMQLEPEQIVKMQNLLQLFEEEFISDEEIKDEMLRMLLVKLIINTTRIAKKQYFGTEEVKEDKFNIVRQFNVLVELHFRKQHQVQYYAGLLNKSPKTIANLFTLYSKKTPLQIIQERIIREAKRLFYYTDKSVKEIADDLGFEDAAYFSKFFKKYTNANASSFKRNA